MASIETHFRRLCRESAAMARNPELAMKAAKHCAASAFPAPSLQTSTTFMANRDDGFGEDDISRKVAHAKAEAAGVSVTGKTYMSQLCPTGDRLSPKAWISDKDDAKRICEANGWECDELGTKMPAYDKPHPDEGPYKIDEQIVRDEVDGMLARDEAESVSQQEYNDLKENTRTRLQGDL